VFEQLDNPFKVTKSVPIGSPLQMRLRVQMVRTGRPEVTDVLHRMNFSMLLEYAELHSENPGPRPVGHDDRMRLKLTERFQELLNVSFGSPENFSRYGNIQFPQPNGTGRPSENNETPRPGLISVKQLPNIRHATAEIPLFIFFLKRDAGFFNLRVERQFEFSIQILDMRLIHV
jgi:hypothetical protein